jgi:hypothetical protein
MNPQMPEAELSPELDGELEQLLRADAGREPYIEDAGFTARLMSALPPRRERRSYSWLGPILGAVGVAGLAGFSSLPADLLTPLQVALHGHLPSLQSLLVLLPVGVLVGFASWLAASESG